MGARHLLAEIDIAEAKGQQSPTDVEVPGTIAEVRVAAGGLGVGCDMINVRAGICTCFCHSRLLTWRCIPVGQAVEALAGASLRLVAVLYTTAFMTLQCLGRGSQQNQGQQPKQVSPHLGQ